MKQLRKYLLLLLACCLLSVCSAGYAEPVYTITEAELSQLELNLEKLSQLDSASKQELQTLKTQLGISVTSLTEAAQQSETLQLQLTELKELNSAQASLLSAANESLEKYAAEERRTRLRIKRQRNTYLVLFVGALIGVCVK